MSSTLQLRLARFLPNVQDQEKFLASYEGASLEEKQKLEKLLDDFEAEGIERLNKKNEEKRNSLAELSAVNLGVEETEKPSAQKFIAFGKSIFSDSKSLAHFAAHAKDHEIELVERVIVEAAPEDQKEELTTLFNQLRLQKADIERKEEAKKNETPEQKLKRRQALIDEADAVIAQAEAEIAAAGSPPVASSSGSN